MARPKMNVETLNARLEGTDFKLAGQWKGFSQKNVFRCRSTGRVGTSFPQPVLAGCTPVWAQKGEVKRGRPLKSRSTKTAK